MEIQQSQGESMEVDTAVNAVEVGAEGEKANGQEEEAEVEEIEVEVEEEDEDLADMFAVEPVRRRR